MASPFSIFRKHQKVAMAVLTVMAMFAFVIFNPGTIDLFTGRGATDPVVVRTSKFGNLYRHDLGLLVQNRQRLRTFLESLAAEVRKNGGTGQAIGYANLMGAPTETSVVDKWLFAREAEQIGMVISDQDIQQFLKMATENKISMKDLASLLQGSGGRGGGLSEIQLFGYLRDELLALRLRDIFQVHPNFSNLNLFTLATPPGQRWDYYCRLNRHATVELAAVPAANFVSQVPDPSDEELNAFFEKHKATYPTPESPEPGFHQPHRIALEYLKADYDRFEKTVTDAEVIEEYQKHKRVYDEYEESQKEKPEAKKPSGGVEKPAAPAEKKPIAEGKPAEKSGDKKPEPEKKPEATAKPATPSEKKPPKKEEPDATEKPAAPAPGPAPAAEEKAEPEKEPHPDNSSALQEVSPFRLTALTEDIKDDKTAEKKPEEPRPDADKKAEPEEKKPDADKKAEPEEKKPDADKKAEPEEKKPDADKKAKPEEKKPDADKKAKPEEKKPDADKKAEPEKKPATLNQYHVKWTRYDAERIRNKTAKRPPPPDFAALAKQHALAFQQTGLLSAIELRRRDIDSSYANSTRFEEYAYQSLSKYRPEKSIDPAQNLYLFWKTDETKDLIPKFDDPGVREEVLNAWKLVRARKLAREAAKSLCEQVARTKKPLRQALAGDAKVVTAEPFTWLTRGVFESGYGEPRISEVKGIDQPGAEFMQTVFSLQPGAVGTAMNQPETIAYVIQLVKTTPAEKVLLAEFESDSFQRYASVALDDQRAMTRAWEKELRESAGLKWEIQPDQRDEEQRGNRPAPSPAPIPDDEDE
ncbi:MAG: hypothetical protein ABSG68_10340 [Thermoguttaceae bacterium]